MSTQPKAIDLPDRQAILEEIRTLLGSSGGIDETRAKQVRKSLDSLRAGDPAPEPADPEATEQAAARATAAQLDAEIDAALETLRARIHKQVERRNRDYDKALGLMAELEGALRDNELQHAERANNRLLSIMGNIPGLSEQRWHDIEKRLNRVRPRLRKLESWRHWGTTQARQELISQVTRLPEEGLAPEELAQRIRQAREQWQQWNQSGDHASDELWKSFDKACEEAYKPCRAHFRKLREQRAEHLRQRQAVIDRLNARYESTDWKAPDWRELDRLVRQARRDFHRAGTIDFKHRKPLARALDTALERFEEYLARERAHSLRVRERLIADIEALAEVEPLREALERLEALKKQWQVTVVSKRKVENELWQRFQAACERTYARRDAERREQDAARKNHLRQKQALIEALEQTIAAGDAALLENAAQLARTRERWAEIGAVPRQQERSLDQRWNVVQKKFRKALQAAEEKSKLSELDGLAQRAALCHRWEQAVLAGVPTEPEAARAEWSALPALSGAAGAAMEQRFAQAFEWADEQTLADNLARKQEACLRLEVILELESPADCQGERMAYQVARLNASLKKDPDARDDPEELLHTALVTGAVPAVAAAAIEQRLQNCLARYRRA